MVFWPVGKMAFNRMASGNHGIGHPNFAISLHGWMESLRIILEAGSFY